jgi:V8-like Glu-specific endopeptidase
MKVKTLFLGVLLLPALLLTARGGNSGSIPSDLRDAPNSSETAAELANAVPSGRDSAQAPSPLVARAEKTFPVPGAEPAAHSKAIIGNDDRFEYYEVPGDIRELADSVAALELKTLPPLQSKPAPPLCRSERFSEQTAVAFCSGFLVAPDIMATAGHCINTNSCSNMKFVFGVAIKQPGVMPPEAPESEVYSCGEVLVSRYTPKSRNDDFALVRLDRPVTGHKPLRLNFADGIAPEGTPIFTIGHFLGFPVKIATNASVRLSDSIAMHSGKRWFTTSLDSFPGNSGGPVFNAKSRLVEGIVVRGGGVATLDFDITPEGCRVAHVYDEKEEWGPEITNIAVTLPFFTLFTQPR